ncbi:MAG: TrmB family transcriptional regulator [Weeksellaceae bacterium]
MDDLQTALKTLGFSDEEIVIYLTALETGLTTVLDISRKTGIPRSTVYLNIDALKAKNLLKEVEVGKKIQYAPASPDELIEYAKHKKDEMNKSLNSITLQAPQLTMLYRQKANTPTIRIFTTVEEIQQLFMQAYGDDRVHIQHTSSRGRIILGIVWENFLDELRRRMMYTKELVNDTPEGRRYAQINHTIRNEVRCLPQKYATEADIILFGDLVIYLTYRKGQLSALVIEDSEIAYTEKVKFMLTWSQVQQV